MTLLLRRIASDFGGVQFELYESLIGSFAALFQHCECNKKRLDFRCCCRCRCIHARNWHKNRCDWVWIGALGRVTFLIRILCYVKWLANGHFFLRHPEKCAVVSLDFIAISFEISTFHTSHTIYRYDPFSTEWAFNHMQCERYSHYDVPCTFHSHWNLRDNGHYYSHLFFVFICTQHCCWK